MDVKRRDFIKVAGAASVGLGILPEAHAEHSCGLARPNGKIFDGMCGAFAAMYTPFFSDGDKAGQLNEERIEQLVEYGLSNGLKGFYLTGSTGEGFLLSLDERKRVLDRVMQASRGRAKLIAHVGCMSTDDTIKLARYAAKIGIDWVSSVAPVYFGQNFDAAYDHYRQVSEATDLPFMIYSIGQQIVPDRDARFFDLKNVCGMKYTGYAYWTVKCLKNRLNKPAVFMAGADEQEACAFALGDVFSGCIGTTDNTIPHVHSALCAAADRGNVAEVARLQSQIVQFVELILSNSNGSWHKATMKYVGLDCGWGRAPNGLPLTDEQLADLFGRLDKLGFVKKSGQK